MTTKIHKHSPRELAIFFTVIGALSLLMASCTTVPTRYLREDSRPTLSVWKDPATTIAISWFHTRGVEGAEIQDSSGLVRRVDAEHIGSVTRVLVDDLDPGEVYSYRAIRLSEEPGEWHAFTTVMPNAGAEEQPFRFVVAGDLQPFNEETVRTTTMALNKIASLNPEFILQTGDVAEVGTSRRSWRLAASVLSAAGSTVPFFATAGNHDYYYVVKSAGNFKKFFPAPYAEDAERKHTWYSVSAGPMHVAILDTEAKGKWITEQLNWLSADLAEARANGAEWIFVAMHRPLFTNTSTSRNLDWTPMILPLLAKNNVDAVFWGHQHLYQHFAYQYGKNDLVYNAEDSVSEQPTHFFTVGTAGARVDSIYAGFFTHPVVTDVWKMYNTENGQQETMEFDRSPWPRENVKREMPGVRYQNPEIYPDAGSYYSYPFDSAIDAENGVYSDDPSVRYADSSEYLGYTYGETSIHYLWVEIAGDTCTITAHYVDGPAGTPGSIITSPDGRQERWTITH